MRLPSLCIAVRASQHRVNDSQLARQPIAAYSDTSKYSQRTDQGCFIIIFRIRVVICPHMMSHVARLLHMCAITVPGPSSVRARSRYYFGTSERRCFPHYFFSFSHAAPVRLCHHRRLWRLGHTIPSRWKTFINVPSPRRCTNPSHNDRQCQPVEFPPFVLVGISTRSIEGTRHLLFLVNREKTSCNCSRVVS